MYSMINTDADLFAEMQENVCGSGATQQLDTLI